MVKNKGLPASNITTEGCGEANPIAPNKKADGSDNPEGEAVLVSGIGIAGPTLAYWLALHGFKTTLVEIAPRLRTGGYVIDFWGRGFDVAEKMDGQEFRIRKGERQANLVFRYRNA